MVDVTDATFEAEVLDASMTIPVVVDLWAEWCGPCKTLGPIIEKVVAETGGKVKLAKVDTEANPQVAQAFQVQSIPAVFAIVNRQVVDNFVGALPEAQVREFVNRLAPSKADELVQLGDEASLRAALEEEPGHLEATLRLAVLELERDQPAAALELLAKVPETPEVHHVLAAARLAMEGKAVSDGEATARLEQLLETVASDDAARQEFLDILETLGPHDPRTASFRKRLTAKLF